MPNPSVMEIFKMVIIDVNKNQQNYLTKEKRQILTQMEVLNSKFNKARELLLSDSIEPADYKTMKFEIEDKINREEAKLSSSVVVVRNIEHILNEASNALFHLDELYMTGDIKQRGEIIGSIYPKKTCT